MDLGGAPETNDYSEQDSLNPGYHSAPDATDCSHLWTYYEGLARVEAIIIEAISSGPCKFDWSKAKALHVDFDKFVDALESVNPEDQALMRELSKAEKWLKGDQPINDRMRQRRWAIESALHDNAVERIRETGRHLREQFKARLDKVTNFKKIRPDFDRKIVTKFVETKTKLREYQKTFKTDEHIFSSFVRKQNDSSSNDDEVEAEDNGAEFENDAPKNMDNDVIDDETIQVNEPQVSEPQVSEPQAIVTNDSSIPQKRKKPNDKSRRKKRVIKKHVAFVETEDEKLAKRRATVRNNLVIMFSEDLKHMKELVATRS